MSEEASELDITPRRFNVAEVPILLKNSSAQDFGYIAEKLFRDPTDRES